MNTDKLPSSPVQKRILLWGGLLLGATLLWCFLIIVLAPKVINRDAFRTRIEAAISGTLGGTVIYDRLDLVLFPQPELKFSDLKIDIPRTGSISINGRHLREAYSAPAGTVRYLLGDARRSVRK